MHLYILCLIFSPKTYFFRLELDKITFDGSQAEKKNMIYLNTIPTLISEWKKNYRTFYWNYGRKRPIFMSVILILI